MINDLLTAVLCATVLVNGFLMIYVIRWIVLPHSEFLISQLNPKRRWRRRLFRFKCWLFDHWLMLRTAVAEWLEQRGGSVQGVLLVITIAALVWVSLVITAP